MAAAMTPCAPLEVLRRLKGADGSEKILIRLSDGRRIESVYLRTGERRTVCVSSQVGCVLDCAFCATGTMGFERNLTAEEIVGQVHAFLPGGGEAACPDVPSNVVFMGMGEPFYNYESVIHAAGILSHPKRMNIAPGRITLSTAGVIPMIQRYLQEAHPFRLAISVPSAIEEKRRQLMPASHRHPLAELRQTLEAFPRRRIMIEVPLLAGINDQEEDAEALRSFCAGLRIRVNLIPWNASTAIRGLGRPSREVLLHFQKVLRRDGMNAFIRNSLGEAVQSACGQLVVGKSAN